MGQFFRGQYASFLEVMPIHATKKNPTDSRNCPWDVPLPSRGNGARQLLRAPREGPTQKAATLASTRAASFFKRITEDPFSKNPSSPDLPADLRPGSIRPPCRVCHSEFDSRH